MIDKVGGKRIGADLNPYVISALISIRDCVNDLPKNSIEFTKNNYKELRRNDDYKYKGFGGFAFSYGGKWLGGWRADKEGLRDYVQESYKNALKQSPKLQGVLFVNKHYKELEIPQIV